MIGEIPTRTRLVLMQGVAGEKARRVAARYAARGGRINDVPLAEFEAAAAECGREYDRLYRRRCSEQEALALAYAVLDAAVDNLLDRYGRYTKPCAKKKRAAA